jgi:hypothetical protein
VTLVFQAAGSASVTTWGRVVPRSANVRNVGAPFRSAKRDSIQLVRTDISRP